jgi:hypothetical protein
MDRGGTMFILGIDFASTTGELLDPASIVGFNPRPEPPADSIYAFNPQPEPPAPGGGLGVFIPWSGDVGVPGSTQISLTLKILDDGLSQLPVNLVDVVVPVPALSDWGFPIAVGLISAGPANLLRSLSKPRNPMRRKRPAISQRGT